MIRIFKQSLKTGVVISRYPAVQEQAPAGFRGRPEVDGKWCNACGACAQACPGGAIRVNDSSGKEGSGLNLELVLSLDYCVFCGACEETCPQGAIVLGREFELAARRRSDLRVKTRIGNTTAGVNVATAGAAKGTEGAR